jgi:predicted RNA-binding protein YlqC (UPF0109 family)
VSEAREVVEFLARALVDVPDEVRVTEADQHGTTVVELFVAPDDLGGSSGGRGEPPLRCGPWRPTPASGAG